jgi:hypothetical protein
MSDIVQKLRVLSRVEMALLKIHLRTLARQTLLCAVGLLLTLLAVAMVNAAIYLFLAERLDRDVAALIVAALNAVLAVGLFLMAKGTRPGAAAAMVEEVRDLAVAGLRADAEAVGRDLNQVKADVERIRSGFSQLSRGGGSLRSLMQLGPLLDLVTSSIKRSKGKDSGDGA